MADSEGLRREFLDITTANALRQPRECRGDWLLDLECDIIRFGKDGFWVAKLVGQRLVAVEKIGVSYG